MRALMDDSAEPNRLTGSTATAITRLVEEAYRAIRTVRPDAAVIIMSGYNEIETSERFAGRGVAGFLQKPYEVARLREMVRQVVDPEQR